MGIPIAQSGQVTEDQGVSGGFLTASGDADYFFGDDTGDWTAESQSGSYGTLVIDADGNWTYSALNSQTAIQELDSGDTLVDVFTITSTNGDTTVTITINGADEPPCFARGTLIETDRGPRPVEALRPGDRVVTKDGGLQVLRWVGAKRVDLGQGEACDYLRPIRIARGAIAPGVPDRDTLVSPMHRVLVGGGAAQLHFGQDEVLAAAKHLVNGQSITIDPVETVEYFHLLFESHEIVITHNLASESFYPGGIGLNAFEERLREEVLALFPELRTLAGAYGQTARDVLKRHEAQILGRLLTPPPDLAGGRAAA